MFQSAARDQGAKTSSQQQSTQIPGVCSFFIFGYITMQVFTQLLSFTTLD